MLDPAACAGMTSGAPRVARLALAELHRLLIERGFRRSSRDDSGIARQEQDEKAAYPAAAGHATPAQAFVRYEELHGMTAPGRRIVLARLTRLFLEAAGFARQERDDDER